MILADRDLRFAFSLDANFELLRFVIDNHVFDNLTYSD